MPECYIVLSECWQGWKELFNHPTKKGALEFAKKCREDYKQPFIVAKVYEVKGKKKLEIIDQ